MELTVKRVSSLAFLVMLVALAPRARPFRATATSLLENNGATNSSSCNIDGGMAKCLIDVIVDEDRDWEFTTALGISRMLAEGNGPRTPDALGPYKTPCGREPGTTRYFDCTANGHNIPMSESCGTYKRKNPCPEKKDHQLRV
ncbi:hypothetical protein CJ030_MR6G013308 [Morella rubra]|uniref:Protein RALF-like 33 n=1 Tax=Morella rubra TaxID=262757 RepID=A0A6A1VH95_9ROSI|nr:hypothetical protein CJ030_MR6G013308 [Morella rubra]